jgi:hypothetical protein
MAGDRCFAGTAERLRQYALLLDFSMPDCPLAASAYNGCDSFGRQSTSRKGIEVV